MNELTEFLKALFTKGSVVVSNKLKAFSNVDRLEAAAVLERFSRLDRLEMPGEMPAFDREAALWAATFIYRSAQLILLRDEAAASIPKYLVDFPGSRDVAANYSVDLSFRFLPDVIKLAKGLAPGDPLVAKLEQTANLWPLSNPSIRLEGVSEDLEKILDHPTLSLVFVDRVIAAKNRHVLKHVSIRALIGAALGEHAEKVWPESQFTSTN